MGNLADIFFRKLSTIFHVQGISKWPFSGASKVLLGRMELRENTDFRGND